jgi:hypothetical protein
MPLFEGHEEYSGSIKGSLMEISDLDDETYRGNRPVTGPWGNYFTA